MPFPSDFPQDLLAQAAALGVGSEDIEETFTRGSGKGGQRRNKRSTCVQLRHIPTGVSVRCDVEREQHQNRLRAYAYLFQKLQALLDEQRAAEAHEAFLARARRHRRPHAAQERVLEEKKRRGEIKKLRRKPS